MLYSSWWFLEWGYFSSEAFFASFIKSGCFKFFSLPLFLLYYLSVLRLCLPVSQKGAHFKAGMSKKIGGRKRKRKEGGGSTQQSRDRVNFLFPLSPPLLLYSVPCYTYTAQYTVWKRRNNFSTPSTHTRHQHMKNYCNALAIPSTSCWAPLVFFAPLPFFLPQLFFHASLP